MKPDEIETKTACGSAFNRLSCPMCGYSANGEIFCPRCGETLFSPSPDAQKLEAPRLEDIPISENFDPDDELLEQLGAQYVPEPEPTLLERLGIQKAKKWHSVGLIVGVASMAIQIIFWVAVLIAKSVIFG